MKKIFIGIIPILTIVVFMAGCQDMKTQPPLSGSATTPDAMKIEEYLTKQAESTPIPTVTIDLELEKRETEIAENPDWVHMVATDPASFIIASGKYQLVEKLAFWCVECRELNPILKSLEKEWGDRINFVYLDVDDPLNTENLDRLSRLRVVPEVILLNGDGKVIKDWIGPPTRDELSAEFQNIP